MRHGSRRRFISVATLLLAVSSVVTAQNPRVIWFSIQNSSRSPIGQKIERVVRTVLNQTYSGITYQQVTAADLPRQIAGASPRDLTFIAGAPLDVIGFAKNDRQGLAQNLNLEIVNPRLGTTPFYFFTNASKATNTKGAAASPKIAYASRAGTLQPDDVKSLFAKAAGVVADRVTVAGPLVSPDVLATRLLSPDVSSGVDVVGIFDEDPSKLLHDFLASYESHRVSSGTALGNQQLIQFVAVPTGTNQNDRARLMTGRLQAGIGDLAFGFVPFNDATLDVFDMIAPEQKEGILTVALNSNPATADSLLLLSNVRSVRGDAAYQQVRRILSQTYFLGLITSQDFRQRCESGSRYGAYLLDALLGDPTSVIKAGAVWNDLALRAGTSEPDATRLKNQLLLVALIVRQRLDVDVSTERGRIALSDKWQVSKSVREEFSGENSSLFHRAQDHLQAAIDATSSADRSRLLALSRGELVTIVQKGEGPACKAGDGGLFGRGLDPFFYLGVVDAIVEMEPIVSANDGSLSSILR